MAYRLKTLSPVHIHSGESIKSINYMVKDNEVLIFNEDDVIKSVKQQELLNDELLRGFATSSTRRKEYNKTLDYYINKGIIEQSIVNKCKVKGRNNVEDLSGQEINRAMLNLQGPYVPGSTIKGVVRTAILYDYLLDKGIGYIKKAIKFLYSGYGRKFTIDDYILYDGDTGRINKDIYKDPFKFLSIKDVNMLEKEMEYYEEFIFNVTNFIPGNVIETIKIGNYSEEFDFSVVPQEKLFPMYNEEIIAYFKEEELLRVLYQYSKDIIDDEIEYFKKNKFPLFNSKEVIESLQEIKTINSKESPVLRLGKGKGYKSNTVALAIKKLDKDYYMREIKRIAKPPKYNKNYEYPKTRKFVGSTISPKLLGFTILEKVEK